MKPIFRLFHAVFCSLLLTPCLAWAQGPMQGFSHETKLRAAEQIVERFYVSEPDTARMVDAAIVAMLKTLDPHSAYSTAEETRELNEPLEGNFSGIGIRFQMDNDTLNVVEAISGGPSEAVGIVPGDKIIACNDTVIAGVKMKNRDIMKLLRGPSGTLADLRVLRRGVRDTLDFRVTRADIPIYSVDAAYMVEPGIGYIRIARFAEKTAQEVAEAMEKLERQGMKDLIIDLTDNGGGYMGPAYTIANMFLKKGDKLVYTESPKMGKTEYVAEFDGPMLDGKIVVMVNQYSASASEILSGALQDNDRGMVVGRRTFGKGLVQRPFPFPDGSMMRLTVSRYHTPSGRCIQKPYDSGDDKAYREDIINRLHSGELMSADSVHLADSLLYHTLRLNRPVYGGGGIMPDVFVPLDTTFYTPYYRDLMAKGVPSRYCFNYANDNRAELLSLYPDQHAFVNEFAVTPKLMKGLTDMGAKEGVEMNQEQYATSRSYLETIVKGLIARDLYGQDAYFRVANQLNPIYSQAIGMLKNGEKWQL